METAGPVAAPLMRREAGTPLPLPPLPPSHITGRGATAVAGFLAVGLHVGLAGSALAPARPRHAVDVPVVTHWGKPGNNTHSNRKKW